MICVLPIKEHEMFKMKKIFVIVIAVVLFAAGCTTTVTDMAVEDTNSEQITKDTEVEMNNDTEEMTEEEKAMQAAHDLLNTTLYDIDGNEYNLTQLGDKTVVKVWASWCGVCLSGMEDYNTFSKEYEDAQVLSIVTPDAFGEKSKEKFIEWFSELDEAKDTVVLFDEGGKIAQGLGVRAFPSYLFIDSHGHFAGGVIGHKSSPEVIDILDTLQ